MPHHPLGSTAPNSIPWKLFHARKKTPVQSSSKPIADGTVIQTQSRRSSEWNIHAKEFVPSWISDTENTKPKTERLFEWIIDAKEFVPSWISVAAGTEAEDSLVVDSLHRLDAQTKYLYYQTSPGSKIQVGVQVNQVGVHSVAAPNEQTSHSIHARGLQRGLFSSTLSLRQIPLPIQHKKPTLQAGTSLFEDSADVSSSGMCLAHYKRQVRQYFFQVRLPLESRQSVKSGFDSMRKTNPGPIRTLKTKFDIRHTPKPNTGMQDTG
ncbi:hypothetical protein DFS34DRAFT_645009 [Phlyctochytrium arcticum]|nr:hypothetical protein DFS34DRAFT_645009 [Phlyctochytrium arcticum]